MRARRGGEEGQRKERGERKVEPHRVQIPPILFHRDAFATILEPETATCRSAQTSETSRGPSLLASGLSPAPRPCFLHGSNPPARLQQDGARGRECRTGLTTHCPLLAACSEFTVSIKFSPKGSASKEPEVTGVLHRTSQNHGHGRTKGGI